MKTDSLKVSGPDLIAKYARLLRQDQTLQKLGIEAGSELQKNIDVACAAIDNMTAREFRAVPLIAVNPVLGHSR